MLNASTTNDKPIPFACIDIETDREGKPTHLGFYDGDKFVLLYSCDDLILHILKSPYDLIYAHAGMHFDFALLLRSLLSHGQITISFSKSSGLFAEFEYGKRKIILADSYRMLPLSLKKVTEKFAPDIPKLDLSGKMPWELPEDELIRYLERDCISLYVSLTRFFEYIDEYGCTRAVTLPALSLKLFRKHFLKTNVMTSNKKLYQFERDSYFGGCCWCRPGRYNLVRAYDVNSMYPYHMLGLFPISYVGTWTKRYKGKFGLYRGRFTSPSEIPFIYCIEERSLTNKGLAILDHDTINYLLSIGGTFKCEVGYQYYNVDYLFKTFVEYFYNKRKESEEPYKTIYKLILNSLYGKFGQKRTGRTITSKEPKNKLFRSHGIEVRPNTWFEIFDYEQYRMVKHSFPVISSLITLRSRVHLHRLLNTPNIGYPIYCDTDSAHFAINHDTSTLDCNNDLGGVKIEAEGRGIYVAKKVYQIGDKIRCKGIPASALDLDNGFENIYSPRVFEFDSFTSLTSILNNDKEFSRETRTRTINFNNLDV